MKKWLLTLALPLLSSSLSFAAEDCTANEDLYLQQTRARFNAGEVTRTDVAEAEYKLLLAQERCIPLNKSAFCEKALPILEVWQRGMEEEARVGRYSEKDLAELRDLRGQVERDCAK